LDYESFLKSVKLYTIALDDVTASLRRDVYWQIAEGKKRFVRTIDSSYEPQGYDGDNFNVVGRLEAEITNEKGDVAVLRINCQYTAHFHASGATMKTTTRFAKSEAKIIIWPYFRQLVSDLTARMSIPPVTIPISLES
jgi:preprotein translocase subunit SecB